MEKDISSMYPEVMPLPDENLNVISDYLKKHVITDHWTDNDLKMINDLFNEVLRLKKENEELKNKLNDIQEEVLTSRYDLEMFYNMEKTESEHSCKNRQFKKQFDHISEILKIILTPN